MKCVLKLLISTFVLLTFSLAHAKPALKDVKTRFDGETFVAEIDLSDDVKTSDILVEYINQTIQLNIPNVRVPKGKLIQKVNKNSIRSVYSYQYDKNIMRTRIIFERPVAASHYEGHVKLATDKNKLIVRVLDPAAAMMAEKQERQLPVIPPKDIEKEFADALTPAAINEKSVDSNLAIISKEMDATKNEEAVSKKVVNDKTVSQVAAAPEKSKNLTKATAKNDISEDQPLKLAKSEKDIPLFKTKKSKKAATESSMNRAMISMFVIVILAGGLLLFAKWWSRNHKPNKENTKIHVMAQHHIGPKKSLTIVRVAGEYILLGVTDHNINHIKTLTLIDEEIDQISTDDFGKVMGQVDETTASTKYKEKVRYNPDESEMNNLQTKISEKLKNMRPLS